jgi:O-antigen/teichoic acid export membrane protein
VARAFGPQGRGEWLYAGTLVAFAMAAAEGVRGAIAHQHGTKKRPLHEVWGVARALALVLGLAGSAAFGALYLTHPQQPAFLFNALAFPFALYLWSISAIYQLRDRVEASNVILGATVNVAGPLVTIVLVAFFHATVEVALTVWVCAYALAALVATAGMPDLLAATPRGGRSAVREQAMFAAKGALSSGVTFLARRVDVLVVAAVLGARDLGVYTLAVATAELLFQVSNALTWAATGRLASRPIGDAAQLLARMLRTLLAAQFAGALLLFIVGPWLLVHVYGAAFAGAGPILRIILPGVVVYSADAALSYFIAVRSGRPGLLFAFEATAFVAGAVLSYAGVKTIGMTGAAIADTATFVLSYVVKLIYVSRAYSLGPADVLIMRPSDVPPRVFQALRGVAQRWAPRHRSSVSNVRLKRDSVPDHVRSR